uniref:nitrous oxide-stimulated promoter family protein n=1 Tax=Alloprevotella sp. TaxID=1872471 RepID=UPI004029A13E
MERIEREKATVCKMIQIYCKHHHATRKGKLCNACQSLQDYALQRLTHCKFGNQKSTCQSCPIHCYRSDMRKNIANVMRFSGPRMLFYHPIAALRHILGS